jgi:rSAM/selenodomain-associated transferase 1
VPGRCKTRLIGKYGARGAARIHRHLALRTLATARASAVNVELWCEPRSQHAFFLKCRREFGVQLRTQPRGDLGRKMALALTRRIARGAHKVIIVGTDCPALTIEHLQAAASALDRSDVVLQPAEDGGYVLIGARRFAMSALRAIQWSSGRELAQTLTRLARRELVVDRLEALWDVDYAVDVARARRAGLL